MSGAWLGDWLCIEGGTDALVKQAELELPLACANSLSIEDMRPNTTLVVDLTIRTPDAALGDNVLLYTRER